ncbi:MAG: Tetratricopeptide repeat protein [Cyanobacteriota bacterium erpe_2018_sw_21hr_WHONDRS-SW48-000092_B_bin.40]|nr:Tetratricopeptide repeat protein [Cyanobacteriota bacterium erpe_2018_sw_21hr_WHONDRS-SW48-000092_B_bin.40]
MQFALGPMGHKGKLFAGLSRSALSSVLSATCALTVGVISINSAPLASAQAPQGGAGTAQQAVGMYNLGLAAYKQGSLESAIIFFRRATDMDPNLADAQYNLGVLYQSQRRLKEAIPRFQEVLRVKSADPDAHFQLGIALMDMGRAAEAKSHLQAIAPSSPHFADAQKRIQTCEAQLAGATVASPSYNPNASAAQPAANVFNNSTNQAMNLNPVATDGQPAPRDYSTISNNPSGNTLSHVVQPQQQVQQVQPVQQIQQVQQVQQTQAVRPVAIASAPVAAARAGAPTAVLANSSARVIATGFSAPSGLTFDRLGNLYVANFTSNTVDRISADGTRMQFSSGSNLKGPIGLAADESGNIYVANYDGGTVARISPAGVSTIIGTGFKQPYYLTLDKEGNLFVSQQIDNSVVRLTLPRPMARTQ